ncbi:MAG TPA: alpha/beta fold hydrolase [Steroidobacteraceae bacterium]|jgi:pimeloyl-ACP methyl ester carboxylesterase
MSRSLPNLLVPGLLNTARLYIEQLPTLWRYGAVMVADHRSDDSLAAIARRILADAPPRFSLFGLSMGGYVAMELYRQAPERIARLALMDTTARPDTPEQSARRRELIELTRAGQFAGLMDLLYPNLVHPRRVDDAALRAVVKGMAAEVGPEAFIRQQTAIINRPDSRPTLAAIACPTLVLVGDSDQLTPPDRAREIAAGIRGAQLVVVPECGHVSALEQAERVTAALNNWLQKLDT